MNANDSADRQDLRYAPIHRTDGGMPPVQSAEAARKSGKTKKPRPPIGHVASLKNKIPMPYWRPAERHFMYLLEVDPAVLRYSCRSTTLDVWVGDKWIKHTIAFHIITAKCVINVDLIHTRSPAVDERTEAIRERLFRDSMAYYAVPVAEVDIQPRLSNAKLLLSTGSYEPEHALVVSVISAIGHGARTLGELEEVIRQTCPGLVDEQPNTIRARILATALRGHLSLDLSVPLSADTPVTLNR